MPPTTPPATAPVLVCVELSVLALLVPVLECKCDDVGEAVQQFEVSNGTS